MFISATYNPQRLQNTAAGLYLMLIVNFLVYTDYLLLLCECVCMVYFVLNFFLAWHSSADKTTSSIKAIK